MLWGSYDIARVSMFAKAKILSLLVCCALGAFGCVSLSATAFAKSDRWIRCQGADPDARIVDCTALIARGNWETKPNQIMAYIYRGAAYRAKGDLDRALTDLDKSLNSIRSRHAPSRSARWSIFQKGSSTVQLPTIAL